MTYDQWRAWCPEAFHWYNHRYHHPSIAHFTPAEVHTARHLALREVRQRALDRACDLHPERVVRGRPVAAAVPGEVWINRPEQEPASNVPQAALHDQNGLKVIDTVRRLIAFVRLAFIQHYLRHLDPSGIT